MQRHPQLGFVPAIAAGAGGAGGASGAAALIPLIGPAVMGVTLGIQLWRNRKGPKQKIAATQRVEELQRQLEANRDGYLSGPRTRSSQTAALQNFDYAWDLLQSSDGCGDPALGDAGKRCISERAPGGKYDWRPSLRDPIANDSQVKDDPLIPGLPSSFDVQSLLGSELKSGVTNELLIGLAICAAVVVFG